MLHCCCSLYYYRDLDRPHRSHVSLGKCRHNYRQHHQLTLSLRLRSHFHDPLQHSRRNFQCRNERESDSHQSGQNDLHLHLARREFLYVVELFLASQFVLLNNVDGRLRTHNHKRIKSLR